MHKSPEISKPLKTLKVIKNTGQTDDGMSRQCFWISIRDWYILKKKEINKTVSEIRLAASSNRSKINGENDDVILEGTNNINDTIEAFANEQQLFIRVFYYDRKTNGLNLGSECLDKGIYCNRSILDFGELKVDNMIIIVAYGGHFELVTEYEEGNFKYNINVKSSTPLEATDPEPLYYNNEGKLVELDKLDQISIGQMFTSQLYNIQEILQTANNMDSLDEILVNFVNLKADFEEYLNNKIIASSIANFDVKIKAKTSEVEGANNT